MRKYILFTFIFILTSNLLSAQSKSKWPEIPGFEPDSPLTITQQNTFFGVMGVALLSYSLAEFVFKDEENLNFYQVRAGVNGEDQYNFRNVFHQNFGVENRVASWFAFALELNLQEWVNRNSNIPSEDTFGMGIGIMTYYRWYLFGKKSFSPYIEYGTGLFQGFEKFPADGTNFTFSHSVQLGVEYTFKNKNRLRLGYGQFHHSNNNLIEPNPGYNGNGLSVSYSWFWKTSKW